MSNDPATISDPKTAQPRTRFFGLVRRREKWTLSMRGWLAFFSFLTISAVTILFSIHSFLAVTDRVESEYLVVEGWIPNYALKESITEFRSKPYRLMFTVGCDILNGVNIEPGENHADYAASRLKWLGMEGDSIRSVPAHVEYRNRTYQSALELRKYIETHHLSVTNFNVVTVGPHARRSRLLFQKAFEGKAEVGIIAVEDREYEPARWWKYSEGVREVISESVAYFYARVIFHAGNEGE